MTKDLANSVKLLGSIKAKTVTTAEDGSTVDAQGYESAVAFLEVGTQSGTSNTFNLYDSPDGSTWTIVAAGNLIGSQPGAITTANDNAVFKVGYKGGQRYLRWECDAATAGNIANVNGCIVLGNPRHAPTS